LWVVIFGHLLLLSGFIHRGIVSPISRSPYEGRKVRLQMAQEIIKATKQVNGVEQSVEATYDFGDSLGAATALFGEEVVLDGFRRSSIITAQSIMRRSMEAGKSQEEVQALINAWKPGVALERTVDPVAALTAKFGKLTPEEQKAIIKQLQTAAKNA